MQWLVSNQPNKTIERKKFNRRENEKYSEKNQMQWSVVKIENKNKTTINDRWWLFFRLVILCKNARIKFLVNFRCWFKSNPMRTKETTGIYSVEFKRIDQICADTFCDTKLCSVLSIYQIVTRQIVVHSNDPNKLKQNLVINVLFIFIKIFTVLGSHISKAVNFMKKSNFFLIHSLKFDYKCELLKNDFPVSCEITLNGQFRQQNGYFRIWNWWAGYAVINWNV